MAKRRKCLGGCGRWLTNAASIALGYGRHCAEAHGITPTAASGPRRPRPVPRPADAPPEPIPGQVEIPLTHFQPTLESL